ncbi:MAG: tetratricopeptide repeat protein, partial [Rhodospirillales bacterium]
PDTPKPSHIPPEDVTPAIVAYQRILEAKGLSPKEQDAQVRDFGRLLDEWRNRLAEMDTGDGSLTGELRDARVALDNGEFARCVALMDVISDRDGHAAIDMKRMLDTRLTTAAMAKVVAGDLAMAQLEYGEALGHYAQATEWLPRGRDDLMAEFLNKQGTAAYQAGDNGSAIGSFRKALTVLERSLGDDHPDVATALNNLALLHYTQADYDAAEPLYRRALAIDERILGEDHPGVATDLNNLALLYKKRGNFQAAKPLLARSLAIKEKNYPPGHPSLMTGLKNYAALLRVLGEDAEADQLETRAGRLPPSKMQRAS